MDYRTFLNADSLPPLGESTPVNPNYRGVSTVTDLHANKGETVVAYSVWFKNGYAPPDKSARMESLANAQTEGSGVALILVDGGAGTFGLDGECLKNLVLRNADTSYAGGLTRLENLYFVNCTFHKNFPSNAGNTKI